MKTSLKQAIEIVGIASVVVSLLFVGYQLMLDRRVALANVYFDRAESFKSDFRSQLESESYMSMVSDEWNRGTRPTWWTESLEAHYISNELSGADVASKSITAELGILHLDSILFQFEQGLFPARIWDAAKVIGVTSITSDPIGKALLMNNPRGLRPLLDEIIAEIDSSKP